jgi:Na+-transporting NADH:ubiquinone oxidoreductase subunit C
MAFDKNSNGFTFGFATVLVILVGVLLAFSYLKLKPYQQENERREKMQNILASMKVDVVRDDAPARYESSLVNKFILNSEGKVQEGGDAFEVDVLKQYKEWKAGARAKEDIQYPLFQCKEGEQLLYVIPLVGTGLWGPIWGYISVEEDGNTVFGSTFDHQGETPGLGAEITMDFFEDQFNGKLLEISEGITANNQYISVLKAGKAAGRNDAVDGITGGTITSDGVDEMLERTLAVYDNYFESR